MNGNTSSDMTPEKEKIYMIPNVTGPTEAVTIDPDICVGCNACVDICRVQTIMPNPVPGKPPVVIYPDECWYCACCVEACRTGALTMNLPINQRIFFKRKETGEIFRLGQSGGPMKSFFKPPFGHYDEISWPGTADADTGAFGSAGEKTACPESHQQEGMQPSCPRSAEYADVQEGGAAG